MDNIELVIKISEKDLKSIRNRIFTVEQMFETTQGRVYCAIVNGTLIPKGHGDLIDRNALEYETASIEGYSELDYECVAREDIEQASVIIPADTETR